MKILVFAPHPDDEIIGCGGTIAKLSQANHDIEVVYVTSGESGSLQYSPMELQRVREDEAVQGAEVLGIGQTHFLHYPDGGVVYSEETVTQVTGLLRELQPDVVFLPHERDAHVDHRVTYQIAKEAIFRSGAHAFGAAGHRPWEIKTVLAYEVWTPLTEFQLVEDISETVNTKLTALRHHASQLENVEYDDAIQGFNRYRGAMTGKGKYCECFQVIKMTSDLWQKI